MYKVKFLFIIGFISFIVKSQNNNGLKILDAVNESLNNNPVIQKFQIVYEDLYVSAYSFIKETIIIFSARSSSPVKEELLAHYSRPPPFTMFFNV